MTDVVQGYVEGFDTKPVSGGKFTVHYVIVNGERVSVGFSKPTVNVGDEVTIPYEIKYGEKQMPKGAKIRQGSVPASSFTTPSAGRSSGGGGSTGGRQFPVPPTSSERTIVRQNSVSNAARIISALIGEGGVAPGKEAQAVIDLAREFEEYSCGDLERRASEQGVTIEEYMKERLNNPNG